MRGEPKQQETMLSRFRGVQRTGLWGHLSMAAYNLLRLATLLPRPAPA